MSNITKPITNKTQTYVFGTFDPNKKYESLHPLPGYVAGTVFIQDKKAPDLYVPEDDKEPKIVLHSYLVEANPIWFKEYGNGDK